MKNKMKNKKGFTLMEMLIVVAIMVVLVAVAVPTFTSQVKRANRAADRANERAAKAVAATTYLASPNDEEETYKFDAASGKLVASDAEIEDYGKDGGHDYILVTISANGDVTVDWNAGEYTEDPEEEEDDE